MTTDHGRSKDAKRLLRPCHYCGEQGHRIAKCPARICENADRQRSTLRANIAQSEDDSGGFRFSVAGNSRTTKLSCEWLVDSGATQHMTFSRKIVENYLNISPKNVHLADDGVVQAIGTGDIVMSLKTLD